MQLNISFSGLVTPSYDQLSLFEDYEDTLEEEKMFTYMDEILNKYGKSKLLKLDSKTKDSTIKERHNQIGGHRK